MKCTILFTLLGGITAVFARLRVVDLTHAHGESTIFWPGNPKYNFTILYRNWTSAGIWREDNKFSTAEHGGTHLDAPSHFAKGGLRTEQIPMEKLFGPGVIINVKSKAMLNPDYRVSISDLYNWEATYGKIPKKSVVIMNSGWSDLYPDKNLVFNSSTPDDPSTFHFPAWHEDAVNWLINNRSINVVGVDTPSNDYGQSATHPVHIMLAKSNITGVENVAFLENIPPNGTMIYVAVIKLQHGSGGPSRVFATIEENEDEGTSN